MIQNQTYQYCPQGWRDEQFRSLGGFTVVFLNYNKAAMIEKAVASALAQDFPCCEMFFMDDASTDGSGDTMERLVREYRGRHRVTVVRNERNLGITGQWNLVAKLAKGNWFGMFCADDIAHPDRVSLAAKRIAEYPTLLGLCFGTHEFDSTGRGLSLVEREEGLHLVPSGAEGVDDLLCVKTLVVGATAFWHRSLFGRPLPFAPFDDVLLRWIAQANSYRHEGPVWLYDGTVATVEYSVGKGVSSFGRRVSDCEKESAVARKVAAHRAGQKFNLLMARSLTGAEAALAGMKADWALLGVARIARQLSEVKGVSTLGRLVRFPAVLVSSVRRSVPAKYRKMLLRTWLKRFAGEFFGLRFLAVVSTMRGHR